MKKNEDTSCYVSPRAICPLYRYQSFHEIDCRGNGCRITLHYPNFMQRTQHLQQFCEKDYEACGTYQAVETGTL